MPSRLPLRLPLAILALLAGAVARAAEPAAAPAPQVVTTTAAAAPAPEAPGSTGRVVNGHTFMPALGIPGALLTTSFASHLVFAGGATSATVQIANRQFEGTVEYAGIGANLAFEYAFLRHFSAHLVLDEILYSGTSGKSAIFVGTTAQVNLDLGLKAGIPLGDTARIALLFDANYGPNAALTIATGIQGIIDACRSSGCDPESGTFFVQRNLQTYRPAVAVSWAPTRALGVTGNVGWSWVSEMSSRDGALSGQAGEIALAVDYDFRAISRVPIGVLAQFRWQAPVSGKVLQHVTDVGGGIYYTGRENLALGLQLIDRLFAVTPDVNVSWSTWIGQIGLRYYW